MKNVSLLVALLTILTASAAAADAPKIEIFGGYSYLRTEDDLDANGFEISMAANVNSWLGLVVDYSRHERSFPFSFAGSADLNAQLILFGPRATLRASRVQPFVHTLLGVGRLGASGFGLGASETVFATAFGGGLDAQANRWLAFRIIQGDYVLTRFAGETQNNARIATGVVLRIP